MRTTSITRRCYRSIAILAVMCGAIARADDQAPPQDVSTALPATVDLRPELERLGLGPRRQGKRNTCSVFTTAAAIEFALARKSGKAEPLSVEYLNWACNEVIGNHTADRGQFFHHLLEAYSQYGICRESLMGYQRRFDPQLAPTDAAREQAKDVLDAELIVHWINPLKKEAGLSDEQLAQVKQVLASGWPVAAGSSHSRLLVGYADNADEPGGGTFLTKDSGSGRFSKVTYEFVKNHVGDVFWVQPPTR